MTGVIAALAEEINSLNEVMTECKKVVCRGLPFYLGKIGRTEVVTTVCGVGKVNAAVTATFMLATFEPGALISVGMAGAVAGFLKQGDIVVADRLVQYDFDPGTMGGGVGVIEGRENAFFTADRGLVTGLTEAASRLATTYVGLMATGDRFVEDRDFSLRIRKDFGALCVEMESCAIAQAAERLGMPFAAVRVISDGGDENAAGKFETFKESGACRGAQAVVRYLQNAS